MCDVKYSGGIYRRNAEEEEMKEMQREALL
jgi:hypothetical protein